MANHDQGFEQFRCDFIAHLAERFGLAPEVVASHLSAWLVERPPVTDEGRKLVLVPPPRTRH